MIAAAAAGIPPEFLCSDAVHYNPSDLAAWVDSVAMLTDLPPEDAGIRLVHLLVTCADSIQRGDRLLAGTMIEEMRLLMPRVGASFGIGKVAGFFVEALDRRLCSDLTPPSSSQPPEEDEILYHYFYEAGPYLKFAHFTANQAILEAFNGHDRLHVVDFSLMQGLQWPALIQALALRPGGPPFLRLTGIGPPSPDGSDKLREVGLRLADLASSVGVPFAFRGVVAAGLDDVQPWMLEALAVNSVLQLHRLVGEPASPGPIDSVLSWVGRLRPSVVTLVEQEADHNKPAFLDRFTEALFYYSTLFDSLEAGSGCGSGPAADLASLAEVYLKKEIYNIVCCEGAERVERHEPLASWRSRMGRSGLLPVHLGSNAFRQASMLLMLFSGEGYSVEEVDGCLTLGWHGRALISASAWVVSDDTPPPPPAPPVAGNVILNYDDSRGFRFGESVTIGSSSSSSNHSITGGVGSQREQCVNVNC
ncbi:DELLA protein DWARF8 [Apostasia shenzhenica]|uniref:DELLA protein n=1 Tax=Apostasia shenzhenica TaxID=1088818 RepID=A0A2I0B9R8_9ASPA|nr:DELLA protein DWARF8 [Apostasia shenzhenica]